MKKKILTIALAVALIAAAVTGATLAFFTDTKTAENTFTVGNVAILLDEAPVERIADEYGIATWVADGESERITANAYENIYPGAVLPKDPIVWNTGASPAYVRVNVVISNAAQWNLDDVSAILTGLNVPDWTLGGTQTSEGAVTLTYYYNTVLAAGADTGALFTAVTIPGVAEALENFVINLTAEAIQAEGFADADAAWAAFDA